MALVAGERGYLDTRVADVLTRARISRRTYYVHFKNREECFFAAYDAIVAHLLGLIGPSAERPEPPPLEEALARALEYFSAWPAHARVLLLEVLAAGPTGAAVHERTMGLLAHRLAECPRWQPGPCGELERAEVAQAVLGAMQRILVMRIAPGGGADGLPALLPVLIALTTRVALAA